MPPRKRAASAPKEEPAKEPETLETEGGQQAELSDEDAASEAEAAVEPQDSDDPGTDGPTAPAQDGETEAAPERSELQEADQPCSECMPNGWPEGAFSVGCTHGTWVRKQD